MAVTRLLRLREGLVCVLKTGHSQRCCAAAAGQRFERFSIAPKNRQQLEHVLVQCNKILQADKRSKHVRRVRISGQATSESKDVGQYFREVQSQAWLDMDDRNGEDCLSKTKSHAAF
jgi:hypothetical protein